MEAENWQRVRALFDLLADLPPDKWEAALDEQGVADPQLRGEVISLLKADGEELVRTHIDGQAPGVLSDLAERETEIENQRLDGRHVGAFRLVKEIGRGGMGTVWRAERVEGGFEQVVAIKLMRPEWDAAEMIRRFRAERQILAHLNHPNIAHLIDGGITDDERPWLALEYVDGIDLRSYCDQHKLDIAKRLKLFMTVCEAVSYAHAHLVVHRDLKPSNLLVTRSGEIKLLDFGIAKLIDHGAIHASIQRVFTPEYAAPEQVRGEAITTSVDVYALGLLLYELLTGRRPYNVKNSTPAAYERAILDQEPTRPSLAFASGAATADLQQMGVDDEASRQQMRRKLRGDLDAIILKALRKDPQQRYASVADFSADIQRHLERQPVVARRGGWRYRAGRFLRRHAMATASVALAVSALAAGLIVATHQRDLARMEADKSERVLEFMVGNFQSADPSVTDGASVTARELLDRGSKRITTELESAPESRALLLETIARAYSGIGAYDQALIHLQQALEIRESLGDPVALARTLLSKARALKSLTRNDESLATVDTARALFDKFPSSKDALGVKSQVLSHGAMHLFITKQFDAALVQYTQSRDMQLEAFGPLDERTLDTQMMISRVLGSQKKFDESSLVIGDVIAKLNSAHPPRKSVLYEAYNALGSAEEKRGRLDLAERANRESLRLALEVYDADHFYVAIAYNNLGQDLSDQSRYEEAIKPLTRALSIGRKTLPATHGFIAAALKNLADAEFGAGRYEPARGHYESVLDIYRQKPETPEEKIKEIVGRIEACDAVLANVGS
ncbi:MAG: serine/threonine-protein kinase [Dokdonella sp.]